MKLTEKTRRQFSFNHRCKREALFPWRKGGNILSIGQRKNYIIVLPAGTGLSIGQRDLKFFFEVPIIHIESPEIPGQGEAR
jgi:hypothetical protein